MKKCKVILDLNYYTQVLYVVVSSNKVSILANSELDTRKCFKRGSVSNIDLLVQVLQRDFKRHSHLNPGNVSLIFPDSFYKEDIILLEENGKRSKAGNKQSIQQKFNTDTKVNNLGYFEINTRSDSTPSDGRYLVSTANKRVIDPVVDRFINSGIIVETVHAPGQCMDWAIGLFSNPLDDTEKLILYPADSQILGFMAKGGQSARWKVFKPGIVKVLDVISKQCGIQNESSYEILQELGINKSVVQSDTDVQTESSDVLGMLNMNLGTGPDPQQDESLLSETLKIKTVTTNDELPVEPSLNPDTLGIIEYELNGCIIDPTIDINKKFLRSVNKDSNSTEKLELDLMKEIEPSTTAPVSFHINTDFLEMEFEEFKGEEGSELKLEEVASETYEDSHSPEIINWVEVDAEYIKRKATVFKFQSKLIKKPLEQEDKAKPDRKRQSKNTEEEYSLTAQSMETGTREDINVKLKADVNTLASYNKAIESFLDNILEQINLYLDSAVQSGARVSEFIVLSNNLPGIPKVVNEKLNIPELNFCLLKNHTGLCNKIKITNKANELSSKHLIAIGCAIGAAGGGS